MNREVRFHPQPCAASAESTAATAVGAPPGGRSGRPDSHRSPQPPRPASGPSRVCAGRVGGAKHSAAAGLAVRVCTHHRIQVEFAWYEAGTKVSMYYRPEQSFLQWQNYNNFSSIGGPRRGRCRTLCGGKASSFSMSYRQRVSISHCIIT